METKAGDNGLEGGGAHLGLTTTDGGRFRFSQFFDSVPLLERLQRNAEIRVSEDAGDCSNRWSAKRISQSAGKQLIGCRTRDSTRRAGSGKFTERIRRRRSGAERTGCTTLTDHALADIKLPQIPLETQGSGIILRYFDKSGFNMNLRRELVQRLNGPLDCVQIILRRLDEEQTETVIEEH